MTILRDAVVARINATRLINLTNQGDANLSTINETILEAAVKDTKAEFLRRAGLTFDETQDVHIQMGVQGVMCTLFRFAGSESENDGRSYCKRWGEAIESMRRVPPTTTGTQTPSRDDPDALPVFDPARFDDYIPSQRNTEVNRGSKTP